MTKAQFLQQLVETLRDYDFEDKEIKDIEMEYASMIDDALENGEDLESFINRMGNPKKLAKSLQKHKPTRSSKLVEIMPFIATTLFFLLGFLANAWHPGWLVFLLIPVSAILTEKPREWAGITTFVALTLFMLAGTYLNLWNPTWSLFLFIIVFSTRKKPSSLVTGLKIYTAFSIIIYHLFVLAILNDWLGDMFAETSLWLWVAPLVFIPSIVLAFISGIVKISIDISDHPKHRQYIIQLIAGLTGLSIVYVLLGVFANAWATGWVVYLLIPIVAIIRSKKDRFPLTEIMPFIATTLFILVGAYIRLPNGGSSFALSWLFFLLIPVSGILINKKGDKN